MLHGRNGQHQPIPRCALVFRNGAPRWARCTSLLLHALSPCSRSIGSPSSRGTSTKGAATSTNWCGVSAWASSRTASRLPTSCCSFRRRSGATLEFRRAFHADTQRREESKDLRDHRAASCNAFARRRASRFCTRRRCETARTGRSPRTAATPSSRRWRCTSRRLIELPLERQRRVAIVSAVEGKSRSGRRWHLGLVDVHLDTALALFHGGPFEARRRQAAALVDALRSLAGSERCRWRCDSRR